MHLIKRWCATDAFFAATQCFLHLEIIEALEAQVVVAMNFLALMLA